MKKRDPRLDVIYFVDKGGSRTFLVDNDVNMTLVDTMLKQGMLKEVGDWITVTKGGWDFWKAHLDKAAENW